MHATCIDDDTLAAYLDGSLVAARRAAVDEHIDRCCLCRRLLAAVGASEDGEESEPLRDSPMEHRPGDD